MNGRVIMIVGFFTPRELAVQALLMERLPGMRDAKSGQTLSQIALTIREFLTAGTIVTLIDLRLIVLYLTLGAQISRNAVWVLFIGSILMVSPRFYLQKRLIALTAVTQGAASTSTRLLHEVIYEADTIKAKGGEEPFRRIWAELTAVMSLATPEQRKLASTLRFWSQGLQQAT